MGLEILEIYFLGPLVCTSLFKNILNFKVSWWPGNVVLAIPRGQLVSQNFSGGRGDKKFLDTAWLEKIFCHIGMSCLHV